VIAVALAALGFLTEAGRNPHVLWTLLVAAGALVSWNALLIFRRLSTNRRLNIAVVVRAQHYLQACAQGSVLVYWGWHWRPVYDAAPLIAAQLLFAYAFDMLLAWSRRDVYTLGFGPFPVIFSINLFLWFRPDWFYFQFLMIAAGFAAKELIRWRRDGRRVHVFNPSSFPLALASLLLILAGASDITRGQDIAISQFYPPQMYLMLFLVALPGQFLFGVASMTLSAVLTTYLCSLVYFAATGTYLFYDSYVPIAIFLGMHLLFTDPSTSPHSELGRLLFGTLYGLSSVGLYVLLGAIGVPTFYDKLLQVPVLNVSVKLLDRLAHSNVLKGLEPARIGRALAPRQRNLAYMAVWAAVFVALSVSNGLSDRHPGQWLPFWDQACDKGLPRACAYVTNLQSIYCGAGSGWACNERGSFERGCRLGFVPACRNIGRVGSAGPKFERAPPTVADYPILLRGSKGPITDRSAAALQARACGQGWPEACGSASP
jgi:hypothetical protein